MIYTNHDVVLVAQRIYEGDTTTLQQTITNGNRVVTNVTNCWKYNKNKGLSYTDFPIAITRKETWTDFWDKFVLYTEPKHGSSNPTREEINLASSDFVYIDYLGPSGNKKVYACSPTKGLYTLSYSGTILVATQVLNQGCVHVNYSSIANKFLICSDSRTTLGTACRFLIWDGINSPSSYEYEVSGTAAPFTSSKHGILYYSSGSPVYGYYIGAYQYDSREWCGLGFGIFYCLESDIVAGNYPLKRDSYTGYYYRNESGTSPDQLNPYNNLSNRFCPWDIKFYQFSNNSIWVIATGGNTYNGWNGNGEDVLINHVKDDHVEPFYRFRFRSQSNNQKVKNILASTSSTYNYYSTTGTGIVFVCCYDSNIAPYWFPGDFKADEVATISYSDSNFKIRPCNLGSGVDNNRWLKCLDIDNYVLLSGGTKFYYLNFAQDNQGSNSSPSNMQRTVHVLLNSSPFTKYIEICRFNNDIYFCGYGGFIIASNLGSTADLTDVSYQLYSTLRASDSQPVQLLSATNDSNNIYMVGKYDSSSGVAVVIVPGSGEPIIDNDNDKIITTTNFDKTVGTIGDIYIKLEQFLSLIKTNSISNPSGSVGNTTWQGAYNNLLSSGDSNIVDFLNGTKPHIY